MADPAPVGGDVSSGVYECTNCGNSLDPRSGQHLPPCPSCGTGDWKTVSQAELHEPEGVNT